MFLYNVCFWFVLHAFLISTLDIGLQVPFCAFLLLLNLAFISFIHAAMLLMHCFWPQHVLCDVPAPHFPFPPTPDMPSHGQMGSMDHVPQLKWEWTWFFLFMKKQGEGEQGNQPQVQWDYPQSNKGLSHYLSEQRLGSCCATERPF